jgi:hypothetical protein
MSLDILRYNTVNETTYSLADEIRLRDQIVNQQHNHDPTSSIINDYHQEFVKLTGREPAVPYDGKNYVILNGIVKEVF